MKENAVAVYLGICTQVDLRIWTPSKSVYMMSYIPLRAPRRVQVEFQ